MKRASFLHFIDGLEFESLGCGVRGGKMLVLSRKKNESIVINDNIVITIIDIRGDKVRIGVDAPRDVSVHRNEIFELIRKLQSDETHTENVGPESSASA